MVSKEMEDQEDSVRISRFLVAINESIPLVDPGSTCQRLSATILGLLFQISDNARYDGHLLRVISNATDQAFRHQCLGSTLEVCRWHGHLPHCECCHS